MIFSIYCLIIALYLVVESALVALNLRNLGQANQLAGGADDNLLSHDLVERSILYSRSKLIFSLVVTFASVALLLALIQLRCFALIDNWVSNLVGDSYSGSVLFVLAILLIQSSYGIPFSLYSTFWMEQKFGFNKMTLRLWVFDQLKALLVATLLLVPLLYGIFWFLDAAGRYWWLYATIFLILFQLLIIFIYPQWIAPLFNRFDKLPDGPLRQAILELTEALSFKVAEVYQVDGSKRSNHSNAYFTGIGKNKRIVLFDTLVARLSVPQITAVLAHEIGHQRLGHIKKLFLVSAVTALFGLFLLDQFLEFTPLFLAFGFDRASAHGALVILIVATEPITYFLSPFFNAISRHFEYQADRFAATVAGLAEDLAEALVVLARDNLSNFTPHFAYSFFHYSHPALMERLSHLDSCSEGDRSATVDSESVCAE